jgi:hypothetical protein
MPLANPKHPDVDPSEVPFNVSEHYRVNEIIGEGAYGVVA